jgi:hypothetical protein
MEEGRVVEVLTDKEFCKILAATVAYAGAQLIKMPAPDDLPDDKERCFKQGVAAAALSIAKAIHNLADGEVTGDVEAQEHI